MLVRSIVLFLSLCFQQVANEPSNPPVIPAQPSEADIAYDSKMKSVNRQCRGLRCSIGNGRFIQKLKQRPFFQRLSERRQHRGC